MDGNRRLVIALAGLLALAGSAAAQTEPLVPIAPGEMLELGAAWDSDARQEVGADGCIAFAEPDRRDGGAPTWTLLTLSRAGGRLLLGLHAAAPVAQEGMREARLDDAARRLASTDSVGFRELCGDSFVAARAWGGQYVAEIEVEPTDVRRASAALKTGAWTDPEGFGAAVEAVIGRFRATARELPGGSRARAVSIEPREALRRALEFPSTVTAETARPFLAAVRAYPESAIAGFAIEVDPTLGWGDAARHVFLYDRFAVGGSSAAARAAEMRKAQVHRERPEKQGPIVLSDRLPASAETEPRVSLAAPEPRPAVGPVAAPPAALGAPDAAPPDAVRVERLPALVFAAGDGPPVFATTRVPPGVYAERVKQRAYWVPGVAAATPGLREALVRAAASAPSRGTTVLFAEVGTTSVVFTDAPPADGIHAEPAGSLRAWIAGVGQPDAEQRAALAAAIAATAATAD